MVPIGRVICIIYWVEVIYKLMTYLNLTLNCHTREFSNKNIDIKIILCMLVFDSFFFEEKGKLITVWFTHYRYERLKLNLKKLNISVLIL